MKVEQGDCVVKMFNIRQIRAIQNFNLLFVPKYCRCYVYVFWSCGSIEQIAKIIEFELGLN